LGEERGRLVPAVNRFPAALRPVRVPDPSLAPATRAETQRAVRLMALPGLLRRLSRLSQSEPTVVPPDPLATLPGPHDPELVRLRSGLLPHRRRLWMRRLVRRGW